jgi:hypothetical protein
LVVAVMVEHISIANCFGSFFCKNFFKKYVYIAHRLSPPSASHAPRTPDPVVGTLSTVHVWNLVGFLASLARLAHRRSME